MSTIAPPTTSTSSLDPVRGRLAARRRRAALRIWGMRAAALVCLIVAATIATFIADVAFELGHFARFVLWLAAGLLIARLGYRRWWPKRPIPRNETAWALTVEREQAAPTSLVAALQFAETTGDDGTSRQLKQAVIESAEQAGEAINPFHGFSWRPLPTYGFAVLMSAAIVVGISWGFPHHADAFASRMLLDETDYPRDTRFTAIEVNGETLPERDQAMERPRARIPQGSQVRFRVQAEGILPAGGSIDLTGGEAGTRRVPLERLGSTRAYRGRIESLEAPRTATIQLGDARPHTIELTPIPRPVLTTHWTTRPPAYARKNAPPPPAPGSRAVAILPGTTISLAIHARRKPLKEVSLILVDPESPTKDSNLGQRFPLQSGENKKHWRLDPRGTPLAEIERPFDYRITARDEEGLSPARDVTGSITLRADRPPSVTSRIAVTLVMPTAKPKLRYTIEDDFAIRSATAHLTLRRGGEAAAETAISLRPVGVASGQVSGETALPIGKLNPRPGDTIDVAVEATDDRGARQGQTRGAAPIRLEVSGRDGILSRIRDDETTTAERLEAIIQQELELGGEP